MPGTDPAATVIARRPSGTRLEVLVVPGNADGFFGNIVDRRIGSLFPIQVPVESS